MVGVACAALGTVTPSDAAQSQASSHATDLSARRYHRHHERAYVAPDEPHYYARPYYYRPYPYGVLYPFVLGYGPWWR